MPVILSIRLCIGSKNTNWKGPDEYIELILKSKPPIRSLFPGSIDFNSVQEPLLTWALSFDSNLPLFRLVATDHKIAPKYNNDQIWGCSLEKQTNQDGGHAMQSIIQIPSVGTILIRLQIMFMSTDTLRVKLWEILSLWRSARSSLHFSPKSLQIPKWS